ncbi:MAG: hypothetical protein P1T08_14430 [Acidimicrobiia bacterium]|nr:hypothetical protein [Acidimicrobiia bacterium]
MTRMISRRLQQLEAISALDELGLMPLDSRDLDDGVVEVVVSDDVVLVIEPDEVRTQEDEFMNTIAVIAVRTRSDEVRP